MLAHNPGLPHRAETRRRPYRKGNPFGPCGGVRPAGVAAGNGFTVKGTGDQGQPLYQTFYIEVQPQNQPLALF